MTRVISFLLSMALVLSMAVPVMAQENTTVQTLDEETVMLNEQTEAADETAPAEEPADPAVDTLQASAQANDAAAASGKCGDAMYWSFDAATETLTITGSGAMDPIVAKWDDFSNGVYNYEPQWWDLPVRHVVVEEGVEYLSDYAFNCPDLQTVKLPTTLKAIPEYGFVISGSMTSFKVPEGIKTITGWPFGNPKTDSLRLADIYLPASLEEMDIVTIYVAGLGNLKNIYFAGTRAQWNAVERVQSASMSALMPSTPAEYAQLEQMFDAINVVCADDNTSDDGDLVIPFDELLFASTVDSITAENVTYYANENPVKPVITVYYKDQTSGPLPENIRVSYPQWPTTPGTYDPYS